MTDGIIQEVIREHQSKIFDKCDNATYRWIIYYHQYLQQELIEKIKQEYERQNKYPMGITLTSLIGDNND